MNKVWLVYKNGLFWGSQQVVAICATETLALEYAQKNEELEPKDRHLYGYHCVVMEVLGSEEQLSDHKPVDLRTTSRASQEEQGLLF